MADPEAYRDRDDPSVVYVVVPGGKFAAIRVNGTWKPSSQTIGDLEDHFVRIKDPGAAESLLKAARTASSVWPVRAK